MHSEIRSDDINLADIVRDLWKGKWWIFSISIIFFVASVFISLNMNDIYESDVVLSPSQSNSQNALTSSLGSLGSLASLAGVNIGNGSSNTDLALEVLQSRKFITNFINTHHILIPLMASESWDSEKNKILIDPDIYDVKKNKWVRKVSPPLKTKPSDLEAYDFFIKKVLSVTTDKDSGIVTVSIDFISPYVAKDWAAWIVSDLNEVMRQRDVNEAQKSIAYLNDQITKTDFSELRTVLFQLVEQQTQTLMLAKVKDDYAFTVVDPAYAPELKKGPHRSIICILSLFVGVFFSSFVVLVKEAIKKNKTRSV